ncbi:phage head closure protein [Chitinophaga pinensis]|uniref:Phage head-tail adaptor n=1 Tax=Chitinophaga pinensis (strain ATCC 43595 / DSM 2588 / LMG 13176 / NBRC 15968 / NCIMB 11800 / UQM 2034) TaxID=485918 RepID=A0A979GQE0_CHIPD|nr:phage head closure protein [Chitinophaga pinensis]ACU61357.1 phage head-tail adaptor [Chitinophaga pinensis DSM 2588]
MSKIKPQGQFNRRIQAQKLSVTQNEAGGMVETWSSLFETWAYVGPVKSWRHLEIMKNTQSASYEVQIRYTPSRQIDNNVRFVYEGKVLVINSIEEDVEGNKRFYVLILTEQV